MSEAFWIGGTGNFDDPNFWEYDPSDPGSAPPFPPPVNGEANYYDDGTVLFSGDVSNEAYINANITFDLDSGGYTLTSTYGVMFDEGNVHTIPPTSGYGLTVLGPNTLSTYAIHTGQLYTALTITDGAVVDITGTESLNFIDYEQATSNALVVSGGARLISGGLIDGSTLGYAAVDDGTIVAPGIELDTPSLSISDGSVLDAGSEGLGIQASDLGGLLSISNSTLSQTGTIVNTGIILAGGNVALSGDDDMRGSDTVKITSQGTLSVFGMQTLSSSEAQLGAGLGNEWIAKTLIAIAPATQIQADQGFLIQAPKVTVQTGATLAVGDMLDLDDSQILVTGAIVNAGTVAIEFATAATLTLAARSSLTATSVMDQGALMLTDAGTSLDVLDGLILGTLDNRATALAIAAGATAEVGSLVVQLGTISIDGSSSGLTASEDVIIGGMAQVGGLVLQNGGSLTAEAGGNAVTIGATGIVTGTGTISAAGTILNDGTIFVDDDETLVLKSSLAGAGTVFIAQGGTLEIDGDVSDDATAVTFDGTYVTSLILADIGNGATFDGRVTGFTEGDVIDLPQVVLPTGSTPVTATDADNDLALPGIGTFAIGGSDPIPTFGLFTEPNGGGGTEIETVAITTLQAAAFNTYTPVSFGGTVAGSYVLSLVAPASNDGFQAYAYFDTDPNDPGPSIIVAFRGTFFQDQDAAIKNVLADTSFLTGTANGDLAAYVSDAVKFLQGVIAVSPANAHITLTGHSLGGALAQILGAASGLPTAAFNAPGSAQIYALPQVASELAPIRNIGPGGTNINYVVEGDQVSQAGTQIGQVYTVPSTLPIPTSPQTPDWQVALEAIWNHLNYPNLATASYTPGLLPPDIVPQLQTAIDSLVGNVFDFQVRTGTFALFDPQGGASFTIAGDPGAPDFATIALPYEANVAEWAVTASNAGTLAEPVDVAPGVTLALPDGTDALNFSALDTNGNPVDTDGLSFFAASFASDGTFSGTLTETDDTTAPCFAAGTRLRTPRGDIPVEHLAIGDLIVTGAGRLAPITWLGRCLIACRRHPRPELVWPVRVAASAFDDKIPARDLWLSPDHAIFLDGALIPVQHLINGRTIAQVPHDSVAYFHVELERHDILLAEGLAVESYLDTGNRASFANGASHRPHRPNASPLTWSDACAELLTDGARVVAARQRLFARAGIIEQHPMTSLQVQADQRELCPDILKNALWRYRLQPDMRSLDLRSPGWVPAHCQASSLDRRTLGARLFAITAGDRPLALEDPAFFSGFHPIETTAEGQCRWTDGNARLVLPIGTRSVTLSVGDLTTHHRFPRTPSSRPQTRQRRRLGRLFHAL